MTPRVRPSAPSVPLALIVAVLVLALAAAAITVARALGVLLS